MAEPTPEKPADDGRRWPASTPPPCRSCSTSSRISVLVTTYQAGKLVMVRDEGDHLNTHFRTFQAPMGLALAGDRLAIGTSIQVWEFQNLPPLAPSCRRRPAARRLLPAALPPRHRQHPDPRDGLRRRRSSGSSTPASPASARSTAGQLRARAGGRRSSRRWSRRTAATSTAWRWRRRRAATSRRWARPTSPAGWRANKARGGICWNRTSDRRPVAVARSNLPRPVDAPLAALVRRPALGLRVRGRRRSASSTKHRPVRAGRRRAGLHPRARLRRPVRLRRAVAGARVGRLQRHPDHRAAPGERTDLRRLRRGPADRADGRPPAVRDRRAGGLRRAGAAEHPSTRNS